MPKSSDKSKPFFQAYWAALVWAAIILLLCSLPGDDLPDLNFWDIDYMDKLEHTAVFAIQGFLMVYGFKRQYSGKGTLPSIRLLWLFVFLASLFGGLTEIFQELFFPSRFADVFDFIANTIGGILGTIVGYFYFKYRARF